MKLRPLYVIGEVEVGYEGGNAVSIRCWTCSGRRSLQSYWFRYERSDLYSTQAMYLGCLTAEPSIQLAYCLTCRQRRSSVERERIPGGCSALLGRRIYWSKVLVREGYLALRGGYAVGLSSMRWMVCSRYLDGVCSNLADWR